MNLIHAPEFSVRVITPASPEMTPRSEIMIAGMPTQKVVAGAVLQAALRWREYVLIFLTEDIPFEDALHIYLLNRDLAVVDSARLGAMYSTGIFSDLDLTQSDTVRFRFFDGIVWTLTLLSKDEFAIPIISEPKGVSRPFKFFRRMRLTDEPVPGTRQESRSA